MNNIIINSNCNLRCDYCFADDYMHAPTTPSENKDMTLETFQEVIAFLKKSKVDHASILGGEPTLHPLIKDFWLTASVSNLPLSLKSNGLWSQDLLDFFNLHSNDDLYSFHLNINHPKKLTPKQWQLICHNVMNLKSTRVRFQLNIEKEDFDYQWLLDLAKKSSVKEIYWSLAAPIAAEGKPNNTFAPQSQHRTSYRFQLESFLKDAHIQDFKTVGVHGPTPCLIDRDLYDLIHTQGSVIDGRCLPVFDIFPDKTVHYCFPLKGVLTKPSIQDVSSLEEITQAFIKETMVLRSLSFPWEDCVLCPEALSGQCHGGCLAQKKSLKKSLENSWEYFDATVPALLGSVYLGDSFLLFRGRPCETSIEMMNFLKLIKGNKNLDYYFNELYSKETTTTIRVQQMDSFSSLVAEAVRREWIVLKPVIQCLPQLR